MQSFHLTYEEIKSLVPFQFEKVSDHFRDNITNLKEGTLFFEDERWMGLSGCSGIILYAKIQGDRVFIAYKKSMRFTWRDSDIEVYCPCIYRQLSGKNAGKLFYFSYYESWRHTSNSFNEIKESMKTEKRWFIPSYI